MSATPCSIIIVADGARPDTLAAAMRDGTCPALARLASEGMSTTITTVFPSVTGPAYAPFLTGRHPGTVGLPGLRWFDRTRNVCAWPAYARSYVGPEMRHIDDDLDASARTLFQEARAVDARPSGAALGALSVLGRGLAGPERIGDGFAFALRTAWTHFRGDVRGWLAIDQRTSDLVVERVARDRPRMVFAALTGIDKTSHATGHDSAAVRAAMRIVDGLVARLRATLEHGDRWDASQLVVVSDHGHSPVHAHDDLAELVASLGLRPLAHPVRLRPGADVAVMVSGNAMAHLYAELERRQRPFWGALHDRWGGLLQTLLARESVDLAIVPLARDECVVHARGRGSAHLSWTDGRYRYTPADGDPLGLGSATDARNDSEAHERTAESDYPDVFVQIARLAECERSGDIILSAARGRDFRSRWEPIPHVSAHGALHAEHMRVPVVMSRAPGRAVRRTTDLYDVALDALHGRWTTRQSDSGAATATVAA